MKIDIDKYWTAPPPEPSAGLIKWLARIGAGWRPNRRIRSLGYYSAAEFYGVYVWEYLHKIRPLLRQS